MIAVDRMRRTVVVVVAAMGLLVAKCWVFPFSKSFTLKNSDVLRCSCTSRRGVSSMYVDQSCFPTPSSAMSGRRCLVLPSRGEYGMLSNGRRGQSSTTKTMRMQQPSSMVLRAVTDVEAVSDDGHSSSNITKKIMGLPSATVEPLATRLLQELRLLWEQRASKKGEAVSNPEILASQLSLGTLDLLRAEPVDIRIATYVWLFAEIACRGVNKYSEAVVLKNAARILGVVAESTQNRTKGLKLNLVTHSLYMKIVHSESQFTTKANAAATLEVRKHMDKSSNPVNVFEMGGWIMFLLHFNQNRGDADEWRNKLFLNEASRPIGKRWNEGKRVLPFSDYEDNEAYGSRLNDILIEAFGEEEGEDDKGRIEELQDYHAELVRMDEDDYIDEVALGSYFMLRMEEEREYERRKVAGNLFRFLIGELMPVKGFVQGLNFHEASEAIRTLNSRVLGLYNEIQPSRDDALLWVRSSARPIVSDLLERSVSVLATERNGQAYNPESQEIVEAESMDAKDMLRASLWVARIILDQTIALEGKNPQKMDMRNYNLAAEAHLFATAPQLREASGLFHDFVEAYCADIFARNRNMLTTERFDILILKQIVTMGDTIAKQLILRGYGTELGRQLAATVRNDPGSTSRDNMDLAINACNIGLDIEDDYDWPHIAEWAGVAYMSEMYGGNPDFVPTANDLWVCQTLQIEEKSLREGLSKVNTSSFRRRLLEFLRGEGGRGEYTDHEFEDKDIGNLKAYVDKCGAPLGHCQQVVREELQNLLSHLLRECARFWREKRRRDAQSAILRTARILRGPVKQLMEAFRGVPIHGIQSLAHEVSVEDALSESDNLAVAEAAYRSQDSEDDKHAEASDIVLSLVGHRN